MRIIAVPNLHDVPDFPMIEVTRGAVKITLDGGVFQKVGQYGPRRRRATFEGAPGPSWDELAAGPSSLSVNGIEIWSDPDLSITGIVKRLVLSARALLKGETPDAWTLGESDDWIVFELLPDGSLTMGAKHGQESAPWLQVTAPSSDFVAAVEATRLEAALAIAQQAAWLAQSPDANEVLFTPIVVHS